MKNLMEQNIEALRAQANEHRKELFNLRLSSLVGQLKDTSQFSKIRKQIARIRTAITIKERSAGQ